MVFGAENLINDKSFLAPFCTCYDIYVVKRTMLDPMFSQGSEVNQLVMKKKIEIKETKRNYFL